MKKQIKKQIKKFKDLHESMFFMEEAVTPFWWWLPGILITKLWCSIFGHNLGCETDGDAESGPITHYWCNRGCGADIKDHFGM